MAEKTERKADIFIEAAPNSRRFDKVDRVIGGAERGIVSYDQVLTDNGQVVAKESIGTYTKQKFPGSKQSVMPYWDDDAHMYKIVKHDGVTFWNQTELNKLVKDLKLRYREWHPNKGQIITEASLNDFEDHFITHPEFRILLEEGEGVIKGNDPKSDFLEASLRGNRSFMDESTSDIMSGDVDYLIKNPQISEEREDKAREMSDLAYDLYKAMQPEPDTMQQILMLFGRDWDPNATTKSLRNQIAKIQGDTVGRTYGEVNQKLFVHYAQMKPDERTLRSTLALALRRKMIMERSGIYEFEGTVLGSDFDSVVTFFKQETSGTALRAIKIRLGLVKE